MKRRYNLTAEEKKIENEIDTYRSVTGEKRKKVESIIAGAKKNKAISLRISNYDLEKLKKRRQNRKGYRTKRLLQRCFINTLQISYLRRMRSLSRSGC